MSREDSKKLQKIRAAIGEEGVKNIISSVEKRKLRSEELSYFVGGMGLNYWHRAGRKCYLSNG